MDAVWAASVVMCHLFLKSSPSTICGHCAGYSTCSMQHEHDISVTCHQHSATYHHLLPVIPPPFWLPLLSLAACKCCSRRYCCSRPYFSTHNPAHIPHHILHHIPHPTHSPLSSSLLRRSQFPWRLKGTRRRPQPRRLLPRRRSWAMR
jgi:hypothetical protein